jgi:hypothetical protein
VTEIDLCAELLQACQPAVATGADSAASAATRKRERMESGAIKVDANVAPSPRRFRPLASHDQKMIDKDMRTAALDHHRGFFLDVDRVSRPSFCF